MPTHLPVRDNGSITTSITSCPGYQCFDEFTSHQLGLSQLTSLVSATLIRVIQTRDAGYPKPSGAYHFDSSSSTHLQSPRNNASQPTRSKPYSTNHCEEEGPTWPFASTQTVHNSGVVRARTIYAKTDSIMRYTKLQKMFATTCGVHKPP